jgi:hypothetical protein
MVQGSPPASLLCSALLCSALLCSARTQHQPSASAAPPPPQLPYTEAVFKEALRLYPPATITTRMARHGMQLGGTAVPPGTILFISLLTIMRDEASWPRCAAVAGGGRGRQLNACPGLPAPRCIAHAPRRLWPPQPTIVRTLPPPPPRRRPCPPAPPLTALNRTLTRPHPRPRAARALEFLPERFLPGGEALAASSASAYAPFGAGARLCVGYKFALAEAKTALLRLYQRWGA